MPLEYGYIGHGGVMVTATGSLAGEDLISFKADLYEQVIKAGVLKYLIVDFCCLDELAVEPNDLHRLIEQDRRIAEHFPGLVIAFASDKDFLFGIGRMWETHLAQGRSVRQCSGVSMRLVNGSKQRLLIRQCEYCYLDNVVSTDFCGCRS